MVLVTGRWLGRRGAILRLAQQTEQYKASLVCAGGLLKDILLYMHTVFNKRISIFQMNFAFKFCGEAPNFFYSSIESNQILASRL